MELKQFFSEKKKHVMRTMREELDQRESMFTHIPRQGKTALERVLAFATKGKNVRGGMVLLAHEMLGGTREEEARKVAVSMELAHSALLIHDDIIDRDDLRRGSPTIHAQYRVDGEKEHMQEAYHFGISQAICAGDIAFFLSFDILAGQEHTKDLVPIMMRELISVALAEMDDAYCGFTTKDVVEEDVLCINRYKTARYTFSLPFLLGASIAQADDGITKQLMQFGESLGILFQIRDDDIGFFGEQETIGKPVGSDIQENKKTLHQIALFRRADEHQKQLLNKAFGNPNMTESLLSQVRTLAEELGIPKYIEEEMQKWATQAKQQLEEITIPSEWKELLEQLIAYNLQRKK